MPWSKNGMKANWKSPVQYWEFQQVQDQIHFDSCTIGVGCEEIDFNSVIDCWCGVFSSRAKVMPSLEARTTWWQIGYGHWEWAGRWLQAFPSQSQWPSHQSSLIGLPFALLITTEFCARGIQVAYRQENGSQPVSGIYVEKPLWCWSEDWVLLTSTIALLPIQP